MNLSIARTVLPQRRGTITVRFLDPRSRKPIRKMPVSVTQYRGRSATAEDVLSDVNATTDKNGEVVVTLHDPLPVFIVVWSFYLSYSGFLLPASEIVNSGIVLDYSTQNTPKGYCVDASGRPKIESGALIKCDVKNASGSQAPAAKPGEIVFVERKRTVWDNMRQELP